MVSPSRRVPQSIRVQAACRRRSGRSGSSPPSSSFTWKANSLWEGQTTPRKESSTQLRIDKRLRDEFARHKARRQRSMDRSDVVRTFKMKDIFSPPGLKLFASFEFLLCLLIFCVFFCFCLFPLVVFLFSLCFLDLLSTMYFLNKHTRLEKTLQKLLPGPLDQLSEW